MLRTSMTGPIVLVEGDTDTRLYRKFILQAPLVRLTHCEGKPALLEAMSLIEDRGIRGVLGICDADFDRITGRSMRSDIVRADLHDAEMMIVHSGAFKHLCEELYEMNMDDGSFQARRNTLLRMAANIGALRLWNEENKGSIAFHAVDPGGFLMGDEFSCDDYLSKLLELSPGSSITFEQARDILSGGHVGIQDGELACGHDFTALLDANAAMTTGRESYGAETVEKMLRLSFDPVNFGKTALVAEMRRWEQRTDSDLLADEILSLIE